jgi:hypothetical protein
VITPELQQFLDNLQEQIDALNEAILEKLAANDAIDLASEINTLLLALVEMINNALKAITDADFVTVNGTCNIDGTITIEVILNNVEELDISPGLQWAPSGLGSP